jgi:hypothetical protein
MLRLSTVGTQPQSRPLVVEVRRLSFFFSQFMDTSLLTDSETCIPAASLTVTLNVSARISNDNH